MTNYTLNTVLTGSASPDTVWRALLDCEAFPEFMEGVKEVSISDDSGDRRTTSWLVELKGSEMEWDQEDVIDSVARRWAFAQTDGDLAHYEGFWQVSEHTDGVALELNVEFDIGLPLVAEMIHPAVAKALEGYQKAVIEVSA